ncbi:MAG TPA: ABC transporter permease [Dinghuibacter sp.]|uniref:ABC transporter permease n=1 Tax=Dinghuibacter sp. TaxID=2024697 RepID=UPI002BBA497E|nr:ABC transporter permease [Dinghuibacter sp.]HTJ13029.1 ABC transporter permease [Dinghuibacter sp.]
MLTITLRSLVKRNRTFGWLNITGLAIGITCASLIFLWVENEYSYNRMFPKYDRLYRILEVQTYEGKREVFQAEPIPLAEAVKKEVPGIRNTARTLLGEQFRLLFSLGDKGINEQGKYADSSLFSMIDLAFVYGDRPSAFREVHSVVISASMARRFFGDVNPVGRALKVDNKQEYTVTGVFTDLPANCSFRFDWLIPYKVYSDAQPWSTYWGANGAETYVELEPGADVAAINRTLKHYLATKKPDMTTECFLWPMKDWNLHAKWTGDKEDGGKITYVRLFTLIAWIILLIACINFMNLATARSEQRAREIGVRKTMGARRRKLIGQFIGEAMVLSFLSVLLSVFLLSLALPWFNQLVHEHLSLRLRDPRHLAALVAIGLLTGLVAGSYPAFYLSSFNPVTVFKGLRLKNAAGNLFIRKGLVVTQFTVSILLIVCTIVIYSQVRYVNRMDMGYKKDNLIYLNLKPGGATHVQALKNALMHTGAVTSVAASGFPITAIWSNGDDYTWQGKDPTKNPLVSAEAVDADYLPTMHVQLKSGRNFYATGQDTANVLINESMAAQMGKEGHVGAQIVSGNWKITVVGIFKDFIYNDFNHSWGPLIFYYDPKTTTDLTLNIALRPGELSASLAKVGKVVRSFDPAYPFEYTFLDDDVAAQFKTEEMTGRLSAVFAVLAIVISCLGLFGLAAFTAERRTKEIGIRKVLGASVAGLTGLLSRDFLLLVGISCLVALPLAGWIMIRWLSDYSYRTALHWWIFPAVGAGAVLIALATVSYQAIRAALANPVDSLRTE